MRSSSNAPPVVHVTFGTANFSQSIARLGRSVARFGISDFRAYQVNSPAAQKAIRENAAIMAVPRGFGYWLWKPYIILDALEAAPDGTLVFYSDAGVRCLRNPAALWALASTRDIVLFDNHSPEWTQRMWTKRDCFVLMGADAPTYWDHRQLTAGFQLYRAGSRARAFVAELKHFCRDPRVLTDAPNLCGLPNFPEFREHRHDQSILTMLAVRHRIETFRNPAASRRADDPRSPYPAIFEEHRRRNRPPLHRRIWNRLVREGLHAGARQT